MTEPIAAQLRGDEVNHLIVSALQGDTGALERLAREGSVVGRLAPALALACGRAGIEAPERWRTDLRHCAVGHLRAAHALEVAADLLAQLGIPWVLLKGHDLATRGVFASTEERVLGDTDVLVPGDARPVLAKHFLSHGWARVGGQGELAERYEQEEGYALQLSHEGWLVEIHYRLWGSVAPGLGAAVIAGAVQDPPLPGGGQRPALPWAWVLAAVHAGLGKADIASWWDLERIGAHAGNDLVAEVTRIAGQHDLQLPVVLAARNVARVFDDTPAAALRDALTSSLSPLERLVCRRANPTRTAVEVARLLSGRVTRLGWRGAFRRIRPHPGVRHPRPPQRG